MNLVKLTTALIINAAYGLAASGDTRLLSFHCNNPGYAVPLCVVARYNQQRNPDYLTTYYVMDTAVKVGPRTSNCGVSAPHCCREFNYNLMLGANNMKRLTDDNCKPPTFVKEK
ncbi:hypothetical protein PGT21_025997 [Puccinia graminis f. sp. tritici]|uniref:Hydrophobin n=1 Tax=Puccinia graminis f. sp. tritici TaxID=56615 RepID=A0A5B0QX28_PUCGR|nr:hypothetical protein PGT21_025997 [Puccinia graminis f. sp. tritici]KAA1134639.1 hypothetical protein PGTUg99_011155 [Puccinia graminis f. sp. tritici]